VNKDGYEYIWIDTCCIDKSSSAELSEAINSMFRWYQEAAVCYTYLSDGPPRKEGDPWKEGSKFRESRWFTRGWTLQELIAPKNMEFFSEVWSKLGSKSALLDLLSDITGIDKMVLQHRLFSDLGIAKKMSWASNRTTTRVEDRAYSLLGLFDVNMPLLYGEGQKAFIRLQEEILKQTDDESLFAHKTGEIKFSLRPSYSSLTSSLFAQSPDCFAQSANIVPYTRRTDPRIPRDKRKHASIPSLITNKGLQLQVFGCPFICRRQGFLIDGWLMVLDCQLEDDVFSRPAVFLSLSNFRTRSIHTF
jgi:hypothetical protein